MNREHGSVVGRCGWPTPGAWCLVAVLCAVVLLFQGATSHVRADSDAMRVETVSVTTEKGTFEFFTEIADNDKDRQRGLMFRTSMESDAAMLFVWEKPFPVAMWMQNTYLSLDMAFILPNGRVAYVAKDTTPQSRKIITAGVDVAGVLEMIAGTAARIGLKPGDVISYRAFQK